MLAGATVALVALTAVAAPAANAAAPVARPAAPHLGQIETGVISADGHRRVLVLEPTTYILRALGDQTRQARLHASLRTRIRVPGGRTLSAVDRRVKQGESIWHISHRAFFDARDSTVIRRALARARAGSAAAPRITVTAREGLDTNGDGRVDTVSTASRTTAMPQPSAIDPDVGDDGQPVGTDPCQYFQVVGPCFNYNPGAAGVFAANYYLATASIAEGCGSDQYQPSTYQDDGFTRVAYMMNTASTDFSSEAEDEGLGALIYVTDRNFTDHPWHYQPIIACVGETVGPPSTGRR